MLPPFLILIPLIKLKRQFIDSSLKPRKYNLLFQLDNHLHKICSLRQIHSSNLSCPGGAIVYSIGSFLSIGLSPLDDDYQKGKAKPRADLNADPGSRM